MADLDKLAESLNVKLTRFYTTPPHINTKSSEKNIGIKRRTWLNKEDDSELVIEPKYDKRIITKKQFKKHNVKLETNRRQIGDKQKTKPETNRGQTGDKSRTSNFNKLETGDKLETKPRTQLETNRRQTGDRGGFTSSSKTNSKESLNFSFSSLTGIQRLLTLCVYEICKQTQEIITPPLTLEFLSKVCLSKGLSIKKSLQRLEEKTVIFRKEFKSGRGGWSRYSLKNAIFQEVLHYEAKGLLDIDLIQQNLKSETKWRQTGDKVGTKPRTQPETSLPSSSSYININKTTTTELSPARVPALPELWQGIDFSSLAEFGFGETHLLQLHEKGGLEPQAIQDSIYHFAHDLKHNDKRSGIKGPVINFFMGILLRGYPYARPENYVSQEELSMRAYLDAKNQERKRLEEMQQRLFEPEFQSWYNALSSEELNLLVPTEDARVPEAIKNKLRMNGLRKHFTEMVWPEALKRVLSQTDNVI